MDKLILIVLLFSTHVIAKGPVWKVENGSNVLYLAGTIHILRDEDYPLPSEFDYAYKQSSILAFETDMGVMKDPQFIQNMIQELLLPNNQTVFQILKPSTIEQLRLYSSSQNINLAQLERFNPSFLAINLLMHELNKIGITQKGVDEFYYQMSLKDKKQLIALESPEAQINYLKNMGQGHEDDFILQTLNDFKRIESDFIQIMSSWKNGDTKIIEELMILPNKDMFPDIHQQLLVDRNNSWMIKIKDMLETPETEMVLVGSAHLIGEEGLIDLLEKLNYKVTQLDK